MAYAVGLDRMEKVAPCVGLVEARRFAPVIGAETVCAAVDVVKRGGRFNLKRTVCIPAIIRETQVQFYMPLLHLCVCVRAPKKRGACVWALSPHISARPRSVCFVAYWFIDSNSRNSRYV